MPLNMLPKYLFNFYFEKVLYTYMRINSDIYRRVPEMLLPSNVVYGMHGEVVGESTGPVQPWDVDVKQKSLPHVQSYILHAWCV